MRILLAAILLAAFLAGCGSPHITDEIGITPVTFPNGTRINAETMRTDIELLKGLMFRESLPPDRGMLFIHPEENTFHYLDVPDHDPSGYYLDGSLPPRCRHLAAYVPL